LRSRRRARKLRPCPKPSRSTAVRRGVFLDRSALFFAREEPTELAVTITWRTDYEQRRSRAIRHDLDAYRDFPYLEVPHDA
jgi:hypothetical protein